MTLLPTQQNFVHGGRKRLGIVQRVLTTYRAPLFKKLAMNSGYTVSVFAGQPMTGEVIKTTHSSESFQYYAARNRYLLRASNMIVWQTNIRKWLWDLDPDILVMEANPRILSHWQAIRWMHSRGRPVLGWGLGELQRTGLGWSLTLRRLATKKLLQAFDSMIGYSSKSKADYLAAGVAPSRVFVAYNSIDDVESKRYLAELSDFEWMSAWRTKNGLDPHLPIVLFVGRLIASKQIDLLIRACIPLLERCQLLIVGDGPARGDLEQFSVPYRKRIFFVGHQTDEALARSFIASDVFVLPGAGGLALHQAMSYGKPVIVSFGDGTEADLVRENYNGFIFQSGNVKDLTSKIETLLLKPQRIRDMGLASLAIVRNEINLDKMAADYLYAVDETLAKSSRLNT